jgi:hypothetical protein
MISTHAAAALCLLALGARGTQAQNASAATPPFTVELRQHHRDVPVDDHVARLEPAPFSMAFTIPAEKGVLMDAARDTSTHGPARRGETRANLPGFTETGRAEALFNPDLDVLLAHTDPSYWCFDAMETHRFDAVRVDQGVRHCTRTVQRMWHREYGSTTAMEEMTGPLFLVFMADNPLTPGGEPWCQHLELRFGDR